MTAPAAAPASGPIAPPAPRASPQPPADRFAFAAVLDSIPGAATKAGASAAEGPPHPSEEPRQEESAPEQSTRHSLLNDGALLASLPFALRAASAMDEGSQAADHASSLAPAATKASGAEASGAPVAPGAKAAAVGRLTGERAFHFGASAGVTASRSLAIDAPFAPAGANVAPQAGQGGESALAADFTLAGAIPAKPFAAAVPASDGTPAPASIAPRAAGTGTNRVESHASGARRGAKRTKARSPGAYACHPTRDLRRGPCASGARRQAARRPPCRSGRVRSAHDGANRSVWRTALGGFCRGVIVRTRRLDAERHGRRPHATRERARRQPRGCRSAGQGDRRRSFAGRPRGRLDDDAARRRQALGRHPRREFSNPKFNRRSARRDRRSHGGDRPTAQFAHCQAGGRQR